jgi:hypothetical protein
MCVLNFLLFKKNINISSFNTEEQDNYNFTSVLFIFYSKAILFQSLEIQREKKENK